MMAAVTAAEAGQKVFLFEKNDRLGKKLLITGKGRCNVTNNSDVNTHIENIPTNPRFLYAALNGFSAYDTMAFFEGLGVPLKTERGNRVFPVSDRAADICGALKQRLHRLGVTVIYEKVMSILTEDGRVSGIRTVKESYPVDAAILATGGASYPLTGSTGDGYEMAKALGHTVTPLKPALVPIETAEPWTKQAMGLSLKNVALTVYDSSEKEIYSEQGEMLFTHFGVTGPLVLSASSHMKGLPEKKYKLSIDLKPALDRQTLDKRLQNDFAKYTNKDFINALGDLLPAKLIPIIIRLSGIDERKKVNLITREERFRLLELLKGLSLTAVRFRPIDEAIITSGGVNVREIDPKTMASKLVAGLYFAGELIDVDAYTGGFNLQIAFATGRLAALSAVGE